MPAKGRKAAIAGVYNTRQGRSLEGETTRRLIVEAVLGALDDAGLALDDVDGITSEQTASLIYDLRLGPAWQGSTFGQVLKYRDVTTGKPSKINPRYCVADRVECQCTTSWHFACLSNFLGLAPGSQHLQRSTISPRTDVQSYF